MAFAFINLLYHKYDKRRNCEYIYKTKTKTKTKPKRIENSKCIMLYYTSISESIIPHISSIQRNKGSHLDTKALNRRKCDNSQNIPMSIYLKMTGENRCEHLFLFFGIVIFSQSIAEKGKIICLVRIR